MPVTVTSLAGEISITTNAESYVGTAGTPAAGDLLLCFVHGAITVAAGTMTGGSLTWTRLTSFTMDGGADTNYVFWAEVGVSPVSTDPTFDCTGDIAGGAFIHCLRVAGHGTIAAPYVVQSKAGIGTSTTPSVTLDATPKLTNAVVGFCATSGLEADLSIPVGWELGDNGDFLSPATAGATAYRNHGETSATISFAQAVSTAWGVVVLEIANAAQGPEAYSAIMPKHTLAWL